MQKYVVTTIDKEYELKKANIPIKGHTRAGKWVKPYIQQRITRTDVSELVEKLGKEGGFSWRPWGKNSPDSGFMLGLKGHGEEMGDGSEVASTMMSWFKKERPFVKEHGGRYYGGWIDHETNKIYLDISLNEQDKDEATRIAKETKEKAIWDVKAGAEIRIEEAKNEKE